MRVDPQQAQTKIHHNSLAQGYKTKSLDFENVPANIQKIFLMICAASTPIHGYFFFFILLFIFSINQCTVIAVNPQVVALSHVDRSNAMSS